MVPCTWRYKQVMNDSSMVFETMLNRLIWSVPNYTKIELGWFSFRFQSSLWIDWNRAEPGSLDGCKLRLNYLAWFRFFSFKVVWGERRRHETYLLFQLVSTMKKIQEKYGEIKDYLLESFFYHVLAKAYKTLISFI